MSPPRACVWVASESTNIIKSCQKTHQRKTQNLKLAHFWFFLALILRNEQVIWLIKINEQSSCGEVLVTVGFFFGFSSMLLFCKTLQKRAIHGRAKSSLNFLCIVFSAVIFSRKSDTQETSANDGRSHKINPCI